MTTHNSDTKRGVPLSWFGRTLWKFTPLYGELIFLSICLRLTGLFEPFLFQVLIDRILPFQKEASLLVVMAIFAAVSLFQLGFEVLAELLGALTANRVTRELGRRIFEHLFKLPYHHLRHWSIGEIIARIGETDAIRSFLVGTMSGVLLDIVFVFLYLAILLILSPQLTLIVLIALPLQIVIYISFGPLFRRRLRQQFDTGATHQTRMVESLSGMTSIKALSAETVTVARLDQTLSANLTAGYRIGLLHIWCDKILFLVDRSITIGILYCGAQLVFSNQLTLGQLIAFNLISEKVTGPIENFSTLWEAWQGLRISRQRLGDIVNIPTEKFDKLPKLPSDITASLELQNIDFYYPGGMPIFKQYNLRIEPNTMTLIVGASGIGKSTFGRIASGLEEPSSGRILLGDCDIACHDPHDVRTKIAYIPQEPYLFSGTLRENLRLGNEDATDDMLYRALDIAAAATMMTQLPNGLDTPVGERGYALSGGQRQRVAIARSLVSLPRVIILDEPTSALDGETQRVMALECQRLRREVTLVIITHAPDLFENPDRIIHLGAME